MAIPKEKLRVLIVDDAPENLDLLKAALSESYTVLAVLDGAKALRVASGPKPPDLILLDVMMPGIDGYEVCTRLKADPATREIPVIFLTALSDQESELRGLDIGAVDYIIKPISLPLVKARVKNHLSLVVARRQLAAQVASLTEAAKMREGVERIMRHDLKTPLQGVIGLSELLSGAENLTTKQQLWVEYINGEGLKILEMINRYLDLFKMENGTYQYHPQPVELVELARRVAVDLETLAEQRHLTLQLTGEKLLCLGEELLCYSTLANLIKNAIEAAPEGSEVKVEFAKDCTCGVVTIHNRGEVPAAVRDNFFAKYSTAGKKKGTGLGTYSAKMMVETMEGSIAMTSSEEGGTLITLRLPAVSD